MSLRNPVVKVKAKSLTMARSLPRAVRAAAQEVVRAVAEAPRFIFRKRETYRRARGIAIRRSYGYSPALLEGQSEFTARFPFIG